MARKRVYRHDVRCPHCGSNWCARYGKQHGRQKYRCNDCQHYFIPDAPRHNYPETVKQQAVDIYCEGTSVNAISRIQGVKHGTLYAWVKKKPALKLVDHLPLAETYHSAVS